MAPTKAQLTAQLNALNAQTAADLAAANAALGNVTIPTYNLTAPGPISSGTYLNPTAPPPSAPTSLSSGTYLSTPPAPVADITAPAPAAVPDLTAADLAAMNDALAQMAASGNGVSGGNVGLGTGGFGTGAAAPTGPDLNQMNAIAALKAMFSSYGLGGDIAQAITDMVMQGYSADTISLIAQDPNSTNPLALAMQARFPANKIRAAAGLPPLSPVEYMANEKAYRQIMNAAGLPKGFYDTNADFTNFLVNDISPTELKGRVDLAATAVSNADPIYANTLTAMYGLSTGDLIAHVLDPKAALPLLQKQAGAVALGTAAQRQGMGLSTTAAESLYGQGVTQAQAETGFKNIAMNITPAQSMAQRWGGDAAIQGQNLVAATFGTAGAAYAEQQLKALANYELGAFSGGSGVDKFSLGVPQEKVGGAL